MSRLIKMCFIIFLFTIVISCSNNVQSNNSETEKKVEENSDFEINIDSLQFNFIPELNHVSFGGNISFKNKSNYDISNLLFSDKYFKIVYSDNTSEQYDMIMFGSWKLKQNSNNKCEIGIDPFRNNTPYLLLDDFNRTPKKCFLKISFTAINIDKEIPEAYEIDVLPNWMDFQKHRGLR